MLKNLLIILVVCIVFTSCAVQNDSGINNSIPDDKNYCEKDLDCIFKAGCYCGCYNINYRNEKLDSMDCMCEFTKEIPDCLCIDNTCQ